MGNIMGKISLAGGIVLNEKGEVALVSEKNNRWSFPKGRIESGETTLQAALREIWEETGLTSLVVIKEIGTYERPKLNPKTKAEKNQNKKFTLFLCTTHQEKLKPIHKEHPEARWFNISKVARTLTHPTDKKFFNSIKRSVAAFAQDNL